MEIEGGFGSVVDIIEDTKDLAKREAGTVMEDYASIKKGAPGPKGTAVVVNEGGRCVALWHEGKLHKKPPLVRENTKLKVVVEKLDLPVTVIDKHRKPLGIIRKETLVNLVSNFREYKTPIYYSGFDSLPQTDMIDVKSAVSDMVEKVEDIVRVNHASLRLEKKGQWVVKMKLSTSYRTFRAKREDHNYMSALNEVLDIVRSEVVEEKEKRLKWRQLKKWAME